MSTGASRTVTSSASNSCGTGPITTFTCYNYQTSYQMIAYPNPANATLNVTAQQQAYEGAEPNASSEGNYLITDDLSKVEAVLLDKEVVRQQMGKFKDNVLQLNTQKLPNDIYYLHLSDQTNKLKLQIIIQH